MRYNVAYCFFISFLYFLSFFFFFFHLIYFFKCLSMPLTDVIYQFFGHRSKLWIWTNHIDHLCNLLLLLLDHFCNLVVHVVLVCCVVDTCKMTCMPFSLSLIVFSTVSINLHIINKLEKALPYPPPLHPPPSNTTGNVEDHSHRLCSHVGIFYCLSMQLSAILIIHPLVSFFFCVLVLR